MSRRSGSRLSTRASGQRGALRRCVEEGGVCDFFLSADMEHPQALAVRAPGSAVTCFARNSLVAVACPEVGLGTDNFLERLLDPASRLGTSTPRADPGGDYAVAMFRQAGLIRDGAERTLAAKALHLVGGWGAASAPPGGNAIPDFLMGGTVDVFLCYRTTALAVVDGFDIVTPPDLPHPCYPGMVRLACNVTDFAVGWLNATS